MVDLFKQNKILFLVVGVVIAGFVWYGLSGTSSSQSGDLLSTTGNSTTGGETSAAERELLNTLLTLRTIRLEGQIFNDPAFRSLRDFGTEIVAEPIGRENPFAPLSNDVNTEAPAANNAGEEQEE